MNEGSKINVNSSSIIDLKAELFRKQEAFRLQKLSESQQQLINSDSNLYSTNNNNKYKLGKRIREKAAKSGIKSNVRNRNNTDLEENQKLNQQKLEEENALNKSREMLEKKTKLYEQLSNNVNLCLNHKEDEEFDDRILVNFEQKAIEKQIRDRNDLLNKRQTNNDTNNDFDNQINSEEEWTEFVDSLGRTRKCLKKDLQHFRELDRQMFQKTNSTNHNNSNCNSVKDLSNDTSTVPHLSRSNELLSNDLRQELDRREWETNASIQMNRESDGQQSDANIHYQNVQFKEIRDHGVAYYSFSKDSQQREEQMNLLNSLREQTKNQKVAKQKLKEKRKLLMRERLAKVAQRKGISIDLAESSDSEEETEPEPIREEEPPKSKPITVREWDIGKEELNLYLPKSKPGSNNSYFEEKRTERNPEFAPPSSYSKNQFRGNFNDKKPHYKSQKLKSEEKIAQKAVNTDNNSKSLDNNKSSASLCPPKPDVNKIISDALSYFRSNPK